MRSLVLLPGEPRRGVIGVQGVAMHDGEMLTLHADDNSVLCIVPVQLLPLVLPLKGRLAGFYPGADYYVVSGDQVLQIRGRPADLLPRLFPVADDGRLCFGIGAQSVHASEASALETSVVWFREIIMERPCTYGLSIASQADRLVLSLHLRGTERDGEIAGWVRWSLSTLGFPLL